MKIVTKVKGKDDFGREKISGNVWKYSHHNPRVSSGDFILYYFPNDKALGIYQVSKETESYEKDGYNYYEGEMIRWGKSPLEFINMIRGKNEELANKFEDVINELISKH